MELLLNLRLLPNYSVQQMAEGCLSVDSVLIKVSLRFVGVNAPFILLNSPGLLLCADTAGINCQCKASH